MRALILAAGRGSRLCDLTDDRPKALVELFGKPLIGWQKQALKAAGIEEIEIVGGYKGEQLKPHGCKFTNSKWATSNMVRSLLSADHLLSRGQTIISYADIIYAPSAVRALMSAKGDVVLMADVNWRSLWELRFANVFEDAESFRHDGDVVVDIGGDVKRTEEVSAQFMGLLKITSAGWNIIKDFLEKKSDDEVDSLDMTALLSLLIKDGEIINCEFNDDPWLEVDSKSDLQIYKNSFDRRLFEWE